MLARRAGLSPPLSAFCEGGRCRKPAPVLCIVLLSAVPSSSERGYPDRKWRRSHLTSKWGLSDDSANASHIHDPIQQGVICGILFFEDSLIGETTALSESWTSIVSPMPKEQKPDTRKTAGLIARSPGQTAHRRSARFRRHKALAASAS